MLRRRSSRASGYPHGLSILRNFQQTRNSNDINNFHPTITSIDHLSNFSFFRSAQSNKKKGVEELFLGSRLYPHLKRLTAMYLSRLPSRAVKLGRVASPTVRPLRPLTASLARYSPHATAPVQSSTTATQPHPSAPSESFHPSTSSVFTALDTFLPRHLGPRPSDVDEMLKVLGYQTLDDFVDAAIPTSVRIAELTDEDDGKGLKPLSELELRRRVEEVAGMNKPMKSYIGMG